MPYYFSKLMAFVCRFLNTRWNNKKTKKVGKLPGYDNLIPGKFAQNNVILSPGKIAWKYYQTQTNLPEPNTLNPGKFAFK